MKLTREQLERFRRTGIRLDREGRFWHEGEVIEHRGLHLALLRWLDVSDEGRPILRLDEQRFAYVDVDDAFLLAVSARWETDHLILRLNDESEEELAYDTLFLSPDNVAYCRTRGRKLLTRLTTAAYYVLAERVHESEDQFVLRAGGRETVIPTRESSPVYEE